MARTTGNRLRCAGLVCAALVGFASPGQACTVENKVSARLYDTVANTARGEDGSLDLVVGVNDNVRFALEPVSGVSTVAIHVEALWQEATYSENAFYCMQNLDQNFLEFNPNLDVNSKNWKPFTRDGNTYKSSSLKVSQPLMPSLRFKANSNVGGVCQYAVTVRDVDTGRTYCLYKSNGVTPLLQLLPEANVNGKLTFGPKLECREGTTCTTSIEWSDYGATWAQASKGWNLEIDWKLVVKGTNAEVPAKVFNTTTGTLTFVRPPSTPPEQLAPAVTKHIVFDVEPDSLDEREQKYSVMVSGVRMVRLTPAGDVKVTVYPEPTNPAESFIGKAFTAAVLIYEKNLADIHAKKGFDRATALTGKNTFIVANVADTVTVTVPFTGSPRGVVGFKAGPGKRVDESSGVTFFEGLTIERTFQQADGQDMSAVVVEFEVISGGSSDASPATANVDYVVAAGKSVTIAQGELSVDVCPAGKKACTVLPDDLAELDEEFTIKITKIQGAQDAKINAELATKTVTIGHNDAISGTFSLSRGTPVPAVSVSEGEEMTVAVTRDVAVVAKKVMVPIEVTLTSTIAESIAEQSPGTITFKVGGVSMKVSPTRNVERSKTTYSFEIPFAQRELEKTVTMVSRVDDVPELGEKVDVKLGKPTGGLGDATVNTALAEVSFAVKESNSPYGIVGFKSTATETIAEPKCVLTAGVSRNTATRKVFVVRGKGLTGPQTVFVKITGTSPGNVHSPDFVPDGIASIYEGYETNVTFADGDGAEQELDINVVGDCYPEDDETFNVEIVRVVGNTPESTAEVDGSAQSFGVVVPSNDSPLGVVQFAARALQLEGIHVGEDDRNQFRLEITRTAFNGGQVSQLPLGVNWVIQDAMNQFSIAAGVMTFDASENETSSEMITLLPDGKAETVSQFEVTLSVVDDGGEIAEAGDGGAVTIYVSESDTPYGVFSLVAPKCACASKSMNPAMEPCFPHAVIQEGSCTTVTVERTKGSDGAVDVTLAVVNPTPTTSMVGTADASTDFEQTSGTYTASFVAGQPTASVKICAKHDVDAETDEDFAVKITGVTPAVGFAGLPEIGRHPEQLQYRIEQNEQPWGHIDVEITDKAGNSTASFDELHPDYKPIGNIAFVKIVRRGPITQKNQKVFVKVSVVAGELCDLPPPPPANTVTVTGCYGVPDNAGCSQVDLSTCKLQTESGKALRGACPGACGECKRTAVAAANPTLCAGGYALYSFGTPVSGYVRAAYLLTQTGMLKQPAQTLPECAQQCLDYQNENRGSCYGFAYEALASVAGSSGGHCVLASSGDASKTLMPPGQNWQARYDFYSRHTNAAECLAPTSSVTTTTTTTAMATTPPDPNAPTSPPTQAPPTQAPPGTACPGGETDAEGCSSLESLCSTVPKFQKLCPMTCDTCPVTTTTTTLTTVTDTTTTTQTSTTRTTTTTTTATITTTTTTTTTSTTTTTITSTTTSTTATTTTTTCAPDAKQCTKVLEGFCNNPALSLQVDCKILCKVGGCAAQYDEVYGGGRRRRGCSALNAFAAQHDDLYLNPKFEFTGVNGRYERTFVFDVNTTEHLFEVLIRDDKASEPVEIVHVRVSDVNVEGVSESPPGSCARQGTTAAQSLLAGKTTMDRHFEIKASDDPYGVVEMKFLRVEGNVDGCPNATDSATTGVCEGNTLVFEISRDISTREEVSVQYEIVGGVVDASDFGAGKLAYSAKLANGTGKVEVRIPVTKDSQSERAEEFTVQLTGASHDQTSGTSNLGTDTVKVCTTKACKSNYKFVIASSDSPVGTISLTPGSVMVTGNATRRQLNVEVQRPDGDAYKVIAAMEVGYTTNTTAGCTANPSVVAQTLNIVLDREIKSNAGAIIIGDNVALSATGVFCVNIVSASVSELGDVITDKFSVPEAVDTNASTAAVPLRFANGQLKLTTGGLGAAMLKEGDQFNVTMTRTGGAYGKVTMPWTILDDSGSHADTEFSPANSTFELEHGSETSDSTVVMVAKDGNPELNETFTFEYSIAEGAEYLSTQPEGMDMSVKLAVVQNDNYYGSFEVMNATGVEGESQAHSYYGWKDLGNVIVQVQRNGGRFARREITVRTREMKPGEKYYATTDTTMAVDKNDFRAAEFTRTFPANTPQIAISIDFLTPDLVVQSAQNDKAFVAEFWTKDVNGKEGKFGERYIHITTCGEDVPCTIETTYPNNNIYLQEPAAGGNGATVHVPITRSDPFGDITVQWQFFDVDGSDYATEFAPATRNGSVTCLHMQACADIPLIVMSDEVAEREHKYTMYVSVKGSTRKVLRGSMYNIIVAANDFTHGLFSLVSTTQITAVKEGTEQTIKITRSKGDFGAVEVMVAAGPVAPQSTYYQKPTQQNGYFQSSMMLNANSPATGIENMIAYSAGTCAQACVQAVKGHGCVAFSVHPGVYCWLLTEDDVSKTFNQGYAPFATFFLNQTAVNQARNHVASPADYTIVGGTETKTAFKQNIADLAYGWTKKVTFNDRSNLPDSDVVVKIAADADAEEDEKFVVAIAKLRMSGETDWVVVDGSKDNAVGPAADGNTESVITIPANQYPGGTIALQTSTCKTVPAVGPRPREMVRAVTFMVVRTESTTRDVEVTCIPLVAQLTSPTTSCPQHTRCIF